MGNFLERHTKTWNKHFSFTQKFSLLFFLYIFPLFLYIFWLSRTHWFISDFLPYFQNQIFHFSLNFHRIFLRNNFSLRFFRFFPIFNFFYFFLKDSISISISEKKFHQRHTTGTGYQRKTNEFWENFQLTLSCEILWNEPFPVSVFQRAWPFRVLSFCTRDLHLSGMENPDNFTVLVGGWFWYLFQKQGKRCFYWLTCCIGF